MRTQIATCLLLLGVTFMAHAETLLYISDAGNQRIVAYRMNDESGELTEVQTFDAKAAPGSLCVDSQNKYLFASLRSTFNLASYAIANDDKLTLLSMVELERDVPATFVATD